MSGVSVSDDTTAATLIDRLEGTLSIVEEGVQLLQGTTYVAEHSVLRGMRRELSQHIRLIIHGVNDSTAPPIAIYPIHMQLSGSCGRPKIIVNVELVELLRGCGMARLLMPCR